MHCFFRFVCRYLAVCAGGGSLLTGVAFAQTGLAFYTVTPCRVADTRQGQGFSGSFGPPQVGPQQGLQDPRTFPILSSGCAGQGPGQVPSTA